MAGHEPRWPEKSREIRNHHFDSSVWNDFQFRDDDIVIATYAKAGTTWVQQIVAQLLFGGQPGLDVPEMSPWVDLRFPPKEVKLAALEAQQHRRFVKTHLPVDALVFSPKAKYIYVGRDGRDVVWSLYNHHAKANETWYDAVNNTPDRFGPPLERPKESIHEYFRDWLERDGHPFWPFFENVRSWWEVRELPNVMLLHFESLKADLPARIREVARFLQIPIDESKWDAIVEHCTFDYMKEHAAQSVPLGGALWHGGAKSFVHKGTNGRWCADLTVEDLLDYEERAQQELGDHCATWLATGEPAQPRAPWPERAPLAWARQCAHGTE